MNFKDWLSGYLEGKESLNKDEIELIKKKMAETFDVPKNYPVYIPYPQPTTPWRLTPTTITCETSTGHTANEFTYIHSN